MLGELLCSTFCFIWLAALIFVRRDVQSIFTFVSYGNTFTWANCFLNKYSSVFVFTRSDLIFLILSDSK
jgi:hypothetical protein